MTRRLTDPLREAGLAVLRFDPRDSGLSGDGGQDYTLSTMADDVITVLDDAGVDRVHAIALSMGGLMLVDLLTRPGSRIASAAFLSAMSPDPDAGFGDDFFGDAEDDVVEATLRAMGAPTDADRVWVHDEVARSEQRAPARPEVGQRHQDAALRFGWPESERLADITVPTLVIHGTADRVLPLRHAQALEQGITGAELHEVEAMGHLPGPAGWDLIAELVVAHCTAVS